MRESKFKTAEARADEICRWANAGLRDYVIDAIRVAMRDQRHVCAEAVAAMGSGNIRKGDAHQIVINATADREEE